MVLLHPFTGTTDAFRDILNLMATRPASAPYIWLAQVLIDWSPVRSQILNAGMLLMTAGGVGLLASALVLGSALRRGTLAAACTATATFVVFPSTVGTFAWGVGVTTAVPALPLFCLAIWLLLNPESSWWQLGLGLLSSLLSHLAYEAFYFQEIPLILIAAALRGGTMMDIRWRALMGAVIVNVACIVFNRLMPGGVHKTFTLDFLRVFDAGYSHLLAILGHAVREQKVLVSLSVLGAMLSGSMCLTGIVRPAKAGIALLVMIGAVVASGFLYAFAGYSLHAEGPMARVFIVIATYYALAAGVLAAGAWCKLEKRRSLALVFWCCSGIGLVALGSTARSRVNDWANAWTYETARLARLPFATAAAGNEQRIYVAIEDKPASTVEPATAPAEIAGAVAWASYRMTNSRVLMVDRWKGTRTSAQWFAASSGWFNRWNGQRFEQGFCDAGTVIYSAPGTELWLWKTSTSVLRKVVAPWEYGCQ